MPNEERIALMTDAIIRADRFRAETYTKIHAGGESPNELRDMLLRACALIGNLQVRLEVERLDLILRQQEATSSSEN